MSPNTDPTASPPTLSGDLQFQTAETLDTRKKCTACNSVLESAFYQVQGANVCEICASARRAFQELPDSKQKFLRAFLYGAGAAFLSWVGWSILVVTTGFQIGLLAIGVGWFVGTAIRRGTEGHTSRKYQLMAVMLTYLAISMSFIPRLVADVAKKPPAAADSQKGAPAAPASQPATEPVGPSSLLVSGVVVVGLAFVSPLLEAFFDFPGGLIGLFIVFLGLQRAWQLTRPDEALITGPFELEPAE
ncbi:MAG: hypothetical protein HYX27_07545 [Acidobacteria bacterium]|nr:hypothetical protein [Acidobacteriota bacterium]